jgi:ubiquinone/menaquinone biosynthesis C-methylase UbiE
MRFLKNELSENHSRLLQRNKVYRQAGYDTGKNQRFVVAKAFPLKGRILEIGTGKGRFLVELLRRVPRVTTVDLSAGEQRFARMNVRQERPGGRARFVVADARKLPWRDRSFDAVVSMNALHHMPQWRRVLHEVERVVRPGGKVVLADFNRRGFAVFDRIHRQEGRIHERARYKFKDVVEWFRKRRWAVSMFKGDCQDVLVALKEEQ